MKKHDNKNGIDRIEIHYHVQVFFGRILEH